MVEVLDRITQWLVMEVAPILVHRDDNTRLKLTISIKGDDVQTVIEKYTHL